jgi:hypothetical protein
MTVDDELDYFNRYGHWADDPTYTGEPIESEDDFRWVAVFCKHSYFISPVTPDVRIELGQHTYAGAHIAAQRIARSKGWALLSVTKEA